MQIIETENSGLARAFKVTLPAADIEQTMENRLIELGREVKMPGFRPGKVPMPLLKQRYAASVMGEVVERAVNTGADKVLSEKNLRPVQQPKVELANFVPGQDVEFTISLEIMPEFKIADFTKIEIEHLKVEVPEKEVAEQVSAIARRVREKKEAEAGATAKMGDLVKIDFIGRIDDVVREGMEAEGHEVELGTQSLIDTFEQQLVGAKIDETREVKVTFPEDYHAKELASKEAVFTVTIRGIQEFMAPSEDDAMAVRAGTASLSDLKAKIEDRIRQSHASMTRLLAKRQLMDKLAGLHDFPVPSSLLEAEFQAIWKQVQKEQEEGTQAEADKAKDAATLEKDYRTIAERRVRLGLLLAEIGRVNQVNIQNEDLFRAISQEARRYPGQEQMVYDFYRKNPKALDRLRAPLYEDAVVDFMLANVTKSEKTISADDLQAALAKLEEEV